MTEHVMKLTPDQAEHASTQMKADVIPKNHPMLWQLSDLFGDHTFFLDTDGLAIIDAPPRDGSGRTECPVVHLANWTDANRTSLVPHKPMPTGQQLALWSTALFPIGIWHRDAVYSRLIVL